MTRKRLHQEVVSALGGRCALCGYDACASALDTHHLDPEDKRFNVSQKASWTEIELEIVKCELLCARCHREVHQGLHPMFLPLPEIDEPITIQLELV